MNANRGNIRDKMHYNPILAKIYENEEKVFRCYIIIKLTRSVVWKLQRGTIC